MEVQGWSDKILVTCKKTSYTVSDTQEGIDAEMVNKRYAFKPVPKIALGPCSYNATFAQETAVPMQLLVDLSLFVVYVRKRENLKSKGIAGVTSESGTPTPADEEENAAIEDSLSTMVDRSSVSNWTHIFDDKMYTPCHDDVGCRLRIQVSALSVADNSVLAGPVEVFTEPVLSSPVAPMKRRLLAIPGAMTGNMSASIRFRVVSYNVLSEIYATKQAYPYCDAWNLSWPYRRKVILAELEETQGDVVCLQEVQADHYEAHLSPMMKALGYDGLFKPKSRECTGLYGKVDGCATFWKCNRFILAENYSIEFNDIARKEAADFGMDDTEARKFMNRLSRDNIAQIIILEVLQPNRPPTASRASRTNICVVNTHLYSNHQRADVKLWQSVNLMREVQHFITARDLPLILCGDFNSEPTSAVYEYMVTGAIEQSHPDLNIGQHSVRILPADASLITHNIEMGSAMFSGMGTEPQFTNYTAKFKGTLDYIFYTPSRLRIMAVTSLPEEDEIRASSGEGLPSTSYPSDHMMLCCDVAMVVSGTGSILRHPMHQQQHNHQQHGSAQKNKNYNRNK
eukprot:gene23683-29928_t